MPDARRDIRPAGMSRRSMLGGTLLGGTGLAAGSMIGATPAAAKPYWKTFVVEHPGGTPDESSIQDALDNAADADGGHVTVGPGTWHIEHQHLRIYANTRLTLSPGTVLLRTGELTAMLSNGPRDGSDTTTSGYDGPGNIIVEGGLWDFNARHVPRAGWALVFGHASDIIVRDMTIRDVAEWHAVEYNAIFNGVVETCTIVGSTDRPSAAWNQEAVSIDLAWPGLQPFGAGDHTQSAMIRVVNNYCEGWPTFAGCHSGYTDSSHDQFVIAGNTVRDLSYWGVSIRNVNRAIISDNSMSQVGGGVWVRPHDDPNYDDHRSNTSVIIANNVVDTTTRDEGIRVLGVVDDELGDGRIYDASITGNTIRRAEKSGVRARWAPRVRIADNTVDGSNTDGIEVVNSSSALISGNITTSAARHGILVDGGEGHHVTGNSIIDTARDGDGDSIYLASVGRATVTGNTVMNSEPKPAHALSADGASSGIFYTNNDVRGASTDDPFDLQGTGHTDTPGNLA